MPKDDPLTILESLHAKQIELQAAVSVLLCLLEQLAALLPSESPSPLRVREAFYQMKEDQLEDLLIGIEDKDPAAAAYLQRIVDEAKAKRPDQ